MLPLPNPDREPSSPECATFEPFPPTAPPPPPPEPPDECSLVECSLVERSRSLSKNEPLRPLPPPLPPALRPPECAIAVDVNDVDKSRVIAGGVTAANLPHDFKNFRRSPSSSILGMASFPSTSALKLNNFK